MDATSKLLARRLFRLRVHEAKGIEFQHLFEKVMQYAHRDFTPIKPHGRVGDRKNDGYIRSSGTYFQVYAPENPTQSAPDAANKAATDFAALQTHWQGQTPIREFRFVFNDEFRGSPPPLESALAAIRSTHGIQASVLLAKDLEDLAIGLADDQVADLLGLSIPESGPFDDVDFGLLGEVIQHVLQLKIPIRSDGILKAPEFEKKIGFNGLTVPVASLLRVASYQNEAVADYFAKNSTYARQQLRDQLNAIYVEGRSRLLAGHGDTAELGDSVFVDLWKRMTPPLAKAPEKQRAAAQEAALIVMAFYFEACDVFESPDVVA
jgi:hypothetical protein